jgi:hypothetical protein
MTGHEFQVPHVVPMPAQKSDADSSVLIRVARADAERILRALDETSLSFAAGPGGANGATACRRLAAEIRSQANLGRGRERGPRAVSSQRVTPSAVQL